jgi:hypothetical protein
MYLYSLQIKWDSQKKKNLSDMTTNPEKIKFEVEWKKVDEN